MSEHDERAHNLMGRRRIAARQIDELVGLAHGLCADGSISEADVDCLQSWLAAHTQITEHPLLNGLLRRIEDVLADGVADADERADLFSTLRTFTGNSNELGEAMRPTSLPLSDPPPALSIAGRRFCLTGTFLFGRRQECERAVRERGGEVGGGDGIAACGVSEIWWTEHEHEIAHEGEIKGAAPAAYGAALFAGGALVVVAAPVEEAGGLGLIAYGMITGEVFGAEFSAAAQIMRNGEITDTGAIAGSVWVGGMAGLGSGGYGWFAAAYGFGKWATVGMDAYGSAVGTYVASDGDKAQTFGAFTGSMLGGGLVTVFDPKSFAGVVGGESSFGSSIAAAVRQFSKEAGTEAVNDVDSDSNDKKTDDSQ